MFFWKQHICVTWKNGTDEPIFWVETEMQVDLTDTGGEGEAGTDWESGIDICTLPCTKRASPAAQAVRKLPAVGETQAQSLGQEDPWKEWQPTPVFLPGDSQGQRSLVGCCLWGHTELDTTEVT